MDIALCITIAVIIIMMIIIIVGSHNKNEEIKRLKQSKLNLISETNALQDQVDMAIERSDKQLAESKRIIEGLKRINTRYELKMRDLKSEIVQLKQEKQRILKIKYN
jgi:hypothetical protein